MMILTSIQKGNPQHLPLVFMHYLGGSAHTWLPVMEALSKHYYCISLDMPGFGDSASQSAARIMQQAEWVRETLNDIGIVVRPWLIGHSMTGKLAAVMALQTPEQVAGVILTAPSPLCPQPMTDQQFAMQYEWQATQEHAEKFVAGSHQKPLADAVLQRTINDVLRANPAAFPYWAKTASQENFEHRYPNVSLPALLLLGEKDDNVPRFPQQLASTLHQFSPYEYEVIEGCGHLLPLEATEELAAIIEAFIKKYP
ncbi:alpha/beta fold hydrolase [Rosenbergiella australiborealis]|uniref:alpha/beta fold hydrolase n=1 Tax=Rosenbergiella australiborealis TaxID=1544696 RepID=UPI001F4D4005|nr:alpha/beta hydrolase [Rosenbergiella australiborealis]